MHDESQPPHDQTDAPFEDAPFFDDAPLDDGGSPLLSDPGPVSFQQAHDSWSESDFATGGLGAGSGDSHAAASWPSLGGEDRPMRGRGRGRGGDKGGPAASALAAPVGATVPADLLAQRAILASSMTDPQYFALAATHVRWQDFHGPRDQHICKALTELTAANQPTDSITVFSQLERMGVADQVGLEYLLSLPGSAGSHSAVEHYAKRVAKLATVRRILQAAHKLGAEGYKPGVDPDAYVNLAETEISGALQDTVRGGIIPISEVVQQVWQGVLDARERGGEVVGISTGFRDIDKKLLGLHRTDLFILAARPAMGKTAFSLSLALNVALGRRRDDPSFGHGVLVFSMEMGREQLVQRLMAMRSGLGLTQLRKGEVQVDDEIRLREVAAELSELRLWIDDTPGLSTVDVRARAKRVAMQGPLDLVIVDYLQLMKGTGGKTQSREQEISEISRGLKHLAKEMHCCVIALSQLNRGVEGRTDKRPMMSDLRESGAIEQDADIIAFIYRDWVYNKGSPEHLAELIIAKQRAGETGTIPLYFDGPKTRFSSYDDRVSDDYVGQH